MKRRLLPLVAVAVMTVGAAGIVASFWVIANPKLDHPSHADAVVVLSGDRGGRLPRALRLVRQGLAPVLVIVGIPDLPEAKALCRASPDFEVICINPEPDTTRTEARATAQLAKGRNWRRLVIVTDLYHIERARIVFNDCVEGSVYAVAAEPNREVVRSWRRIAHEQLGILQALVVSRGC